MEPGQEEMDSHFLCVLSDELNGCIVKATRYGTQLCPSHTAANFDLVCFVNNHMERNQQQPFERCLQDTCLPTEDYNTTGKQPTSLREIL